MSGDGGLRGGLYHELLECGQQRVFTVRDVVVQQRTGLGQFAEIVDLEGYGPTLFIDGVRQSSAADEAIYHEMLVHPGLFSVGRPRSVLIAGGGEGATAREVLRHRSVARAVQVDLDPELVGLCREHLPTFAAGAYEDPRLQLVFDDVRAWLQRTDERFDAIVLDVPELVEGTELEALYDASFYALLQAHLAPGGVVTGQIGPVHPTRSAAFLPFARARRRAFPHVAFTVVPELGWVFGVAGMSPLRKPAAAVEDALIADGPIGPVRYYSHDIADRLTFLPIHLATSLAGT